MYLFEKSFPRTPRSACLGSDDTRPLFIVSHDSKLSPRALSRAPSSVTPLPCLAPAAPTPPAAPSPRWRSSPASAFPKPRITGDTGGTADLRSSAPPRWYGALASGGAGACCRTTPPRLRWRPRWKPPRRRRARTKTRRTASRSSTPCAVGPSCPYSPRPWRSCLASRQPWTTRAEPTRFSPPRTTPSSPSSLGGVSLRRRGASTRCSATFRSRL